MDKLEQYLDQVCRRVGGPRSLRNHVRQELREHLLDAVAEHRARGLSEADALAKALEDFGGAEEVRSGLEATHGQRLMAMVVDRAIEWKETTMKAKWLWVTWANLAVLGVIALEILSITFAMIYIVPRFKKMAQDGILDPDIFEEQGVTWMPRFLDGVAEVTGHYTTPILLVALGLWGLFEWRVRSENKSFIRLSLLGTVATGLMAVVLLTAGCLEVLFTLGVPAIAKIARPFAVAQVDAINAALDSLREAAKKSDWAAMESQAEHVQQKYEVLLNTPSAIPALFTWKTGPGSIEEARQRVMTVEECRTRMKSAPIVIERMRRAIRTKKNVMQVEHAIQEIRDLLDSVKQLAEAQK